MPTMSVDSERVNGELNLATIPKNVPSLCIPRVFPNITSERVKAVFEQLGIGRVERVDIVVRTGEKGETLKRVFVHLEWNDSENAAKARQRLLCGNDIKVIYDEPWFWKISANRSTREPGPQVQESRPQPRREYQDSRYQGQDSRQQPRRDDRQYQDRREYQDSRQDSRPRRDEYQDSRQQYYESRSRVEQKEKPQEEQLMIRQPKRRIVKRQLEPRFVEMPRAEFAVRPLSPHSPPPRDEEKEEVVEEEKEKAEEKEEGEEKVEVVVVEE